MKLGFFVNDIETEVPQYTTTCLALEAARRGHEVWYIGPGDFAHETDDQLYAHARRAPKKKRESLEEFLSEIQATEQDRLPIEELDVLMLRSDPSQEATTRPWAQNVGVIFGQVAAERGVLVLNDPHGLAQALTKLYFLQFPETVRPSTLVTRSTADVEAFVRAHNGQAVLKPLTGSGGQGVFLVREEEANLNQMIDAVARDGYMMVQEYLPAAEKGDVRLFLVNGVPFEHNGKYAAFARIRKGKDMRSNMRCAGGQAEKATITEDMLALAEAVRPKLIRDGMFFVGLDVAGDKLMEINVFSPGGLHSASQLTKIDFVGKMIDALERKVEYERLDSKVTNTALAML